jgi:hypothetical protein
VAQGITSPKDIVDYVRRTQGLEISPSYASGLKNQLLKEQGAAKRQTGRKPRQEANDEQEGRPAPTPAAASAVSPASGLTPRDLAALGEIAQRVGGVDRLREFLDLLKKIR